MSDADAEAMMDEAGGGGIMGMLWPTHKPIYMRPGALIGGLLIVGGGVLAAKKLKK